MFKATEVKWVLSWRRKKNSVLSFENYPHFHQMSVTKQWLSCLFVPWKTASIHSITADRQVELGKKRDDSNFNNVCISFFSLVVSSVLFMALFGELIIRFCFNKKRDVSISPQRNLVTWKSNNVKWKNCLQFIYFISILKNNIIL